MPTDAPTDESSEPSGIRRQYHLTQLALKHGLSRADARRVIAAAGGSREKADDMATTLKNRSPTVAGKD